MSSGVCVLGGMCLGDKCVGDMCPGVCPWGK